MEGDRKAYSEESQNIIRKQRAAIASLQAENEELMKDSKLAGSQQNENNSWCKTVRYLHYILCTFQDKILYLALLKVMCFSKL